MLILTIRNVFRYRSLLCCPRISMYGGAFAITLWLAASAYAFAIFFIWESLVIIIGSWAIGTSMNILFCYKPKDRLSECIDAFTEKGMHPEAVARRDLEEKQIQEFSRYLIESPLAKPLVQEYKLTSKDILELCNRAMGMGLTPQEAVLAINTYGIIDYYFSEKTKNGDLDHNAAEELGIKLAAYREINRMGSCRDVPLMRYKMIN
ncbi:hypothetical protein OpiT1DRAFT_03861 [Opitutaceae bacterium TAV1]|nr:hypothetical protein OpiT1DRAFT_03861 [Opitutaceae bacterium TAV1]